MSINQQDNICIRCHNREKFFETFKKCSVCSKKNCQQCWSELQTSDDYKLLIDILPKVDHSTTTPRRICLACNKILLEHTFKNPKPKNNNDEDYQLALAMSLSQNEAEEKRKKPEKNKDDILLEQTTDAIEKFMNRAKSNYQRNRDAIGDTALLSAFISLQTCATDLERLKHNLYNQRQYFETLQEKLTALRDAREALNLLRYEHQENKRKEQEHRRLLMLQKVAELRQLKHTQIANFQENYFQHLLNEEREMTERLKKQKIFKHEQFGSQ